MMGLDLGRRPRTVIQFARTDDRVAPRSRQFGAQVQVGAVLAMAPALAIVVQ